LAKLVQMSTNRRDQARPPRKEVTALCRCQWSPLWDARTWAKSLLNMLAGRRISIVDPTPA
jgi:hypothetical protein